MYACAFIFIASKQIQINAQVFPVGAVSDSYTTNAHVMMACVVEHPLHHLVKRIRIPFGKSVDHSIKFLSFVLAWILLHSCMRQRYENRKNTHKTSEYMMTCSRSVSHVSISKRELQESLFVVLYHVQGD